MSYFNLDLLLALGHQQYHLGYVRWFRLERDDMSMVMMYQRLGSDIIETRIFPLSTTIQVETAKYVSRY